MNVDEHNGTPEPRPSLKDHHPAQPPEIPFFDHETQRLDTWAQRLEAVHSVVVRNANPQIAGNSSSAQWTTLLNSLASSPALQLQHSTDADSVAIDAAIEEGRLKEIEGKKGTLYQGPPYEYAIPGTEDWRTTHNETTRKILKGVGIEIQHKFRQFLRITYNTVKSGRPSRPTHVFEGWDSLKLPSFSWARRLPQRGSSGATAGEIPWKILKDGDYPGLTPGGSWVAPVGSKRGDKAQFLFQYMTLRCERSVRNGKASEWWCCGRWFWWILMVFKLVDEEDREVKATYKRGDGAVPRSVQKEAGVLPGEAISTSLLSDYNCNSD
jgi:hypothetical protein